MVAMHTGNVISGEQNRSQQHAKSERIEDGFCVEVNFAANDVQYK